MLRTFRSIWKAEVIPKRNVCIKPHKCTQKDFMSHTLLTFVSILCSCLGQNLGVKSFLIPLFTSYMPNPAYVADLCSQFMWVSTILNHLHWSTLVWAHYFTYLLIFFSSSLLSYPMYAESPLQENRSLALPKYPNILSSVMIKLKFL